VNSILSQDFLGALEVILALGPSRDRTDEVAQSLAARDKRIKLVANPSGKTAAGLNIAIAASESEVIVRVDGHAEIPRDYISLAVEILRETGAVNVGGVMAAAGVTKFEMAVASAMRSLYLPPGLSIGAKLKSSLDLKLYTILIMDQSLLMPKFSALKYCKPLCLTIKT
jgi:glycosyltransferase involved in cell wall biosynthesis